MSWSFTAIGRPKAVREKARAYVESFRCSEPEESIKQQVFTMIETALFAMPAASAVRVAAHGGQSQAIGSLPTQRGRCASRLKFAVATRRKPNLLNHLRRISLAKSVHVIGRADVHKSSNL
jgi:hypothetical protein